MVLKLVWVLMSAICVRAQDLEQWFKSDTTGNNSSVRIEIKNPVVSFVVGQLKNEAYQGNWPAVILALNEEKWSQALILVLSQTPKSNAEKMVQQFLQVYLSFRLDLKFAALQVLLENPGLSQEAVVNSLLEPYGLSPSDPIWVTIQGNSVRDLSRWGLKPQLGLLNAQALEDLDVNRLESLRPQVIEGSIEARILHRLLFLKYASLGETQKAAQSLNVLIKSGVRSVEDDWVWLDAGRLLYQVGLYEPAIEYYQRVGRSSSLWFDAQEEMAWAYGRLYQWAKAYGLTKDYIAPSFRGMVRPSLFWNQALAALRVCDYSQVIKVLQAFRDHFKDRVSELEVWEKDPSRYQQVMKAWDEFFLSHSGFRIGDYKKISEAFHPWPMGLRHKARYQKLVLAKKHLEQELGSWEKLSQQAVVAGVPNEVQNVMIQKVKNVLSWIDQQKILLIQKQARAEIAEIQKVLSKLHVIEADMLTHLMLKGALKDNLPKTKPQTASVGREDQLVFRVSDKDEWFDEVGYKVVELKGQCELLPKVQK